MIDLIIYKLFVYFTFYHEQKHHPHNKSNGLNSIKTKNTENSDFLSRKKHINSRNMLVAQIRYVKSEVNPDFFLQAYNDDDDNDDE